MDEVKGYFMEDEIYWKGEKQPPRKTPIISIDDNGSDTLHVLSVDGNWYTINRQELMPVE